MTEQQPLILLADDEPEILGLYKMKLERAGYRVMTAANGLEAVEIATRERPDLIIMDIKMPELDGVGAQQQLKQNPVTKDLKVLFLTAFSDPTRPGVDKVLAGQLGAIDFIKKGIGLDDLVIKVKECLAM